MNFKNRLSALLVVALALLMLGDAALAITISRVRGGALLGRPLDVAVQVQYAPDEDATDGCYTAQVQFGDVWLQASQVGLTATPGNSPKTVQLRVISKNFLDEPTVALTIGVGCGQKVSRTFYLLAEVLTEARDVPVAATDAEKSSVAIKKPSVETAVPSPVTVDVAPSAKPNKTRRTSQKIKAASSAESPFPSEGATPRGSAKAGNRVEFQIEELEKRLDSVLQQKIEATQNSVVQNEAKIKSLDADLKSLQLLTAKNQKNVELLAKTIEQSSSADNLTPLVYALAGALLACLGGGAYFVWSAHRVGNGRNRWWAAGDESTNLMENESVKTVLNTMEAVPEAAPGKPSAVKGVTSAPAASEGSTREPVVEDIDLAIDLDALESQAIASKAPPASVPLEQPERTEKRDFAHSTASALRAINTREMLDIRQQAEFFMALGQHDDAIKLLQDNINDNEQTNPLVYLDLLKVLHTLGRKQEFDQYAAEFNLQFTGRVPEFGDFDQEGSGLDEYNDICSQIVQLWPRDDALDYIEHCLIRTPEDDPDTGFELEAFRDLLMLHGILRRLDTLSATNMAPFSATRNPNSEMGALSATTFNPGATVAGGMLQSQELSFPTEPMSSSPLTSMPSSDHEHLDLLEISTEAVASIDAAPSAPAPAPTLATLDLSLDDLSMNADEAPPPAIAPSAYADLSLGGKTDNLIDFDLGAMEGLGGKVKKS